jgi:hypothetical protein
VSTAGVIRERSVARRRWLDHAVGQLEAIPAVVAVWLWGSGGRGDDDALSDWDIFVAWHDASEIADLDAGWFRRFGDVLWWHEDPFDAPREGRYVATGYPAPYSPLPVDWYLQPASAARIGTDTRVLLEHSPLSRTPVETFALFPTVTNDVDFVLPTDPVERVQHQLGWFWFMYAPMAKWAARGDEDRTRDQLEGLNRVLREAADLVGQQPLTPSEGDAFGTVRALGDAMTSLHPALRSVGVELPSEVTERLRAYDEANEIRRRGWLH